MSMKGGCQVYEGSNSASGSAHVCHAGAPGSIPVARGRGLWRFISGPSTMETVYTSLVACMTT